MSNYFNQLSLRDQLHQLGNADSWKPQNLKTEYLPLRVKIL